MTLPGRHSLFTNRNGPEIRLDRAFYYFQLVNLWGGVPMVTTTNYAINGYFYGVHDIVTMFWGDAKYTWNQSQLKPYVWLQGGWENNGGQSVIGKINSQLVGVQLGANVTKNVLVAGRAISCERIVLVALVLNNPTLCNFPWAKSRPPAI